MCVFDKLKIIISLDLNNLLTLVFYMKTVHFEMTEFHPNYSEMVYIVSIIVSFKRTQNLNIIFKSLL